MRNTSAGRTTELLLVAAVCAFVFFFGLGSFGLVGADEPRYAQIASEMLARHDWVTPVLYGQPWLEKPILYYWQAMLAFSVFGVSDWAARVPPAIDATLLVLGAYLFARRYRPCTQAGAALITATCAALLGFSRGASTDMPLAATFGLAMLCWLAWRLEPRRVLLLGFYVFMALATLAKGPVAVFLAGAIIAVFAVLRRDWRALIRTLWLPGILAYFAVALPWYVLVELRTHQFFQVFIIEHNLARYSQNVFFHVQPFWYYGIVLSLALLPWLVLAIAALVRSRKGTTTPRDSEVRTFLLVWGLLPVIFFSASQSKLPGYILPAIPAFTLLTADWLGGSRRLSRAVVAGHGLVTAIVLSFTLLAQFFILRLRPSGLAITIAVIAGLAAALAVFFMHERRGVAGLRIATVAVVVVAFAFLLRFISPTIDAKESSRPVAQELSSTAKGLPVAGLGIKRELEYGLAFYRNQPTSRYERAEIPAGQHVLITRSVQDAAKARGLLGGRELRQVGAFAPQKLTFWLVAPSQ